MRIVLDTNVFVSALVFEGVPGKILDLNTDGLYSISLSHPIINELRRVLRESFDWSVDDIEVVLHPILSRSEIVEPAPGITGSRDADDNHILGCAVAAKADAIVTGDRDLLDLSEFGGIPILTPREFLDRLA